MPSATLIHQESDITAGALKVNDAYDLKFRRKVSGDYEVIVFMKIQFFFTGSGAHIWTAFEKTQFMKNWEKEIKKAWGGKILKILSTTKKVYLNFEFQIQQGGWMMDHWEITVEKIKPGSFATSYVVPSRGNVKLDSEDLTSIKKAVGYKQRGAVHEFGHMLGLLDEYKNSVHVSDTGSVMHSAELIRARHNSTIVKWMNNVLTVNKIR